MLALDKAREIVVASAACAGQTDLMYGSEAKIERARQFCSECPVVDVCLWMTMRVEHTHQSRYGVAGGLPATDRKRLGAHTALIDIDDKLRAAVYRRVTGAPLQHVVRRPQDPTADILEVVAESFGFTVSDLRCPQMNRRLVAARQTAMYVLRHTTDLSFPAIGRALGRDHTTVVYACRRVEGDPEMRARAASISEIVSGALRVAS